jgi:hypothetical protein
LWIYLLSSETAKLFLLRYNLAYGLDSRIWLYDRSLYRLYKRIRVRVLIWVKLRIEDFVFIDLFIDFLLGPHVLRFL